MQFCLKRQCVLVPADFKNAGTSLSRPCDENFVIALALKRSSYRKQNIQPVKVNKFLEKLREINPFYRTVSVHNSWENVSQESDPELWDILTNENAKHERANIIGSDK